MKTIFGLLFFVFAFSSVNASSVFQWKIVRVVDGDTIEVDPGFLPPELKLKVRVLGVDTPETGGRAKCAKEAKLGEQASAFTKSQITDAVTNKKPITFSEIKWDKYGGRVNARVNINGEDLTDLLIKKGLAKPYRGEKKQSWCN
jgi:endonuclease YncB( thermonuclease family)